MAAPASVDDLRPATHACLTFTDAEERLDLLAAFVRDGLHTGYKVVCVTDGTGAAALCRQLAERGLPVDQAARRGQVSVLSTGETFLADGAFDADLMIRTLAGQIDQARHEGYPGFWFTSDMAWALRPVAGLDALMAFEARLSELVARTQATALCQYDRRGFDPVTLTGVAARHELALAAATYHDDALLRICRQYQPPGVRISGEIDYRAAEPLTRALSEAIALDDDVDVNLTELAFTDGSAAGTLLQAAAGLRAGQRMTLRCRSQAAKILSTLGVDTLSGVAVVVVDDE